MTQVNYLLLKRFCNLATIYILCALSLSIMACSSMRKPQSYATPEAALSALRQAIESRSVEQADALFGSDGDYLLHTGDPVLDKQRGSKFVNLFEARHELIRKDDQSYVLTIGKSNWPFPFPLVQGETGWYFDAVTGKVEILTREIGRNELTALEVSRIVPIAQRSYAVNDWDGDGAHEYADRIISTPGNRDGLYWPTAEYENPSPMGFYIAKAADENYTINQGGQPIPYSGYYFKVLKAESSAQDATDVLSRPGRYWFVAIPAQRGVTGVMAFATNERGWIYEKDMKKNITLVDLDSLAIDQSWTRIE